MAVKVVFECDGCHASADGTDFICKRFVSVTGRSYGIGSVQYINTVEDVKPPGWWAYDPATYLCYCPDCRKSIEEGGEDADEATA